MQNVAFITGITGQDGSYLAEMLLERDYIVHGLVHRPDLLGASNIGHLIRRVGLTGQRLILHNGAYEDATHLRRIICHAQPTEFYHLAGQSSPRLSLELPETTVDSIGMGTLRLLEIVRDLPHPPKFLYASSAEVFGSPPHSPQDEFTPRKPTTPYGAAKVLSQTLTEIYRTAYKLHTCSAILYNHESPRRSRQFVTMKIAHAAAAIKLGLLHELHLGNLQGRRDWGWAPDYVQGMWLMLQCKPVDDFIFATGVLHTVEDFANIAFRTFDLNWREYVRYDASLITAIEPAASCGNATKAQVLLKWNNTVPFEEIAARMAKAEYDKLYSQK